VINREEQKTSLFKRIAVIAAAFLTGGLLLISDNARSIVLTGKAIRDFAVPASVVAVEREIVKLELEKSKAVARYQGSYEVIRTVFYCSFIGGVTGAVATIGLKELCRDAIPPLFEAIAQKFGYIGFNGMVDLGLFSGLPVGAAIGLHSTKKVSLKEGVKIIAMPTLCAAGSIQSILTGSYPVFYPQLYFFAGTVSTALLILSSFGEEFSQKIREIDKKLEALTP
jgi:hypothetical protein